MEGISDSSERVAESDNEQRVYLVPYRWWRDAHESSSSDSGILYTARPGASSSYVKIINNIFNSDLVFNLSRQDDADNAEVGRDYALVPGDMWLQALKWHHSNTKVATKNGKCSEDDMADVYPLHLRLSALHQINSLGVKISKKDNAVELFRRACKIFSIESDLLRIWDFSGQTSLFLVNNKNKFPKDCQRQSDQEILLELQIYGLSDSMKCREGKKDEMTLQYSNGTSSYGASFRMNGSAGNMNSNLFRTNSTAFFGRSGEAGCLGLTGLQNLGNTCFMNSALQCLAHTPKLVDYFLGDYGREINHENPLGMEGEIALAFGDLLRKLWVPGASPVAPRIFKSKLARFAPQFSGFNQHDSQELLAFLLDGLHEDLNRVKCKPYVEAKDGDGRSDEDIADEYWQNHLARNDSIIVDLCQGQYKSTLVCPVCKKVSITFDPFMYLSLPLPSTTMRTVTLTVVSTDGTTQPSSYTITVPKNGKFEDLIKALSAACSLGVDESLLVAEIYNHRIIRYLEEPADSLSLIRDEDRLVAYRLRKDTERDPLVVFMHQQMEEQYINGKPTSSSKALGIPLVAKVCNLVNGLDICNLYLKLLSAFQIPAKDTIDNNDISENTSTAEVARTEDAISLTTDYGDATAKDGKRAESPSDAELQFYITDEKGIAKHVKIIMNEPVTVTGVPGRMYVLVCWPEKQIQQYDTHLLSSLPEISKSGFLAKKPQESVSLYKCLEAFLTEEPLGPDDMWFCPGCKKHCQASKKLDLWRLPEILVIHLKRFSYSRFLKNKLETYVDFPVENLDLSTYVAHKNGQSFNRYMLYAVSNHYGSMGGGHYTAFVHHGGDRWYDFDDSQVCPISQEKIKTSAAYVLFYRRVVEV